MPPSEPAEVDDFGLPIRKYKAPKPLAVADVGENVSRDPVASGTEQVQKAQAPAPAAESPATASTDGAQEDKEVAGSKEEAQDIRIGPSTDSMVSETKTEATEERETSTAQLPPSPTTDTKAAIPPNNSKTELGVVPVQPTNEEVIERPRAEPSEKPKEENVAPHTETEAPNETSEDGTGRPRPLSVANASGVGEFSHQQLISKQEEKDENKDEGWQEMPAYAAYDIYDDDNKLVARERQDAEEEETYAYGGLGGAGKGYTRVQVDDDAESATSMDENTQYLFKDVAGTSIVEEGDEVRDALSQMQATKDLLTEGQRIAYVGITRLELYGMLKEAESMVADGKKVRKEINIAAEAMQMWAQKSMIRLYTHMEISSAEQIMIEQLSEHGVMPRDLTPVLMHNARVKNPMAMSSRSSLSTTRERDARPSLSSIPESEDLPLDSPPPYESHPGEEMPRAQTPSQLPTSDKIDIDIRWTVLCDLFLLLIADSIYDARSRTLLERVGKSLEIPWLDICRFEKRITDALEMQQAAEKENWNEEEHMEHRRKSALKRRYVMMGLATVGGGLVIGLSAGLMAPMIGAGLAAGFTTIGVGGTSSFLAGVGGAAIITSGAAASGSIIGVRAANRRTGAVKTFEYRPLHNNKRVNLVITVSGWMTGKVDDVRLPFSTVDPIMGDIYSVLWEPEMLTSMGDTINILATEALTQGLQQVLGSTILISLMAALQLPVVLTKLSYLIDNPWAVSLDRATMAGLILADSLIERNLGTRPVTLVGYSLGSRVIFSCLQELSRKGAYGLVQNVYLFGSPVVVKQDEYKRARAVVSGRFLNGYNKNDWILGYLFRLTNGGIRRVAGLAEVEDIPGLENFDVTEFVVGHMDYRTAMPRLLRECGWMVESDDFAEIEDPDPDDHKARQRELINEIEEARKGIEKKESKGAFGGFFSRRKKKAAEKEEWEVYEDSLGKEHGKTEDSAGHNHGVLFDVDAIRAELAKEQLEVREIESTLPPMKLDIPQPSPVTPNSAQPLVFQNPRESLKATKSADSGLPLRPSHSQTFSVDSHRSQEYQTSYIPSRKSPLPQEYYHAPEDDGIQMTFDTTFDESPRSRTFPREKEPLQQNGDAGFQPDPGPTRPEMRSSQTVPNITLQDPWADVDDPDFGKEKEISMTFA